MLNVVIIEDEQPAVENLISELDYLNTGHNVVAILRSVEESIKWFKSKETELDLIFMYKDIPVYTGQCFVINFSRVWFMRY